MGLLMPLWALVVPFCLGLFVQLILRNAGHLPPLQTLAVLMGLILFPLACVVITAICEDDRILISKEGILFPLLLLPALKFRRERLWPDLCNIGLRWQSTVRFQGSDYICLYFKSGGMCRLGLRNLPRTDLEQMLLAIEVWGSGCRRPPELVDFQNTLQNENKGISTVSYTQMWEEELRRRFSATSFVPLEPGHEMRSGHLKIIRQLAFGGLSAIYLAQLDGRELVVVKEAVVPANADLQASRKADELFNREARLLIKLQHPCIARVLDHFAEQGRNYLLLEYINGQDLRQLVKQHGPQPEDTVLAWALQVAGILRYLHGQDPPVIHRDLTPDNLVLREDGKLKLIDFGAANEFVGTATGTLVGKQSYIAPEQFRGKAVTGSDIYAAGCTIHFLLTGQDPEALSVSRPRELNCQVSAELDELVQRCTAMETEDRLPDAASLERAIAGIMSRRAALLAESC